MTSINLIETELKSAFPDFNVAVESFENSFNASIFSDTEWYQFDILLTDNQVGLTYRKIEEIDFGGSDAVFDNIKEAISFLKNYRHENKNAPNR